MFDKWWNQIRRIHPGIYIMGLVSFFIQLGATMVYTTAESMAGNLIPPSSLLLMRSLGESIPTILRVISGMLSDYHQDQRTILMWSYGSMIVLKIVFFLCIALNEVVKGGIGNNTTLLACLTYIYVSTYVADRIMACLRDAPQSALMLQYINENNRLYISSGDHNAEESKLVSLATRKCIASLGSLIGGIVTYCIVKMKLLSAPATYALAIVPIIIGNIILYFGVARAMKVMRTPDVVSSSKVPAIERAMVWYNKNQTIIEVVYLAIGSIVAYLGAATSIKVILFILFHKMLYLSENESMNGVARILLLIGLGAGYGWGVFIAFSIGIMLSSSLSNLYYDYPARIQSFIISCMQSKINFRYLNNISHKILYTIAIILLLNKMPYMGLLLIVCQYGLMLVDEDVANSFAVAVILIVSQLKVYEITRNLISYLCFTITSTLGVYAASGDLAVYATPTYVRLIMSSQLATVIRFAVMSLTGYANIFYIVFALQIVGTNVTEYICGVVIAVCSYFKITARIVNRANIVTRLGSALMIVDASKAIYRNRTHAIMMGVIFSVVGVVTCIFKISLTMRMIIVTAISVFVTAIMHYLFDLPIVEKLMQYREKLYRFLYMVIIICVMNIGRFNDGLFYRHGYTNIARISVNEVPLMFAYSYSVIVMFTLFIPIFIPKLLKKNKEGMFWVIGSALVLGNILLWGHNIYAFAASIMCMAIYVSASEVLFVSLIEEVIPSADLKATFLGIYYLGMSLSTILNAVLLGWITDPNNMMSVINASRIISHDLYTWMSVYPATASKLATSLFCIFPIISLILVSFLKPTQDKNTLPR